MKHKHDNQKRHNNKENNNNKENSDKASNNNKNISMSPRGIFVAMLTLAFCLHFDNSGEKQGERERERTYIIIIIITIIILKRSRDKGGGVKRRAETIEGAGETKRISRYFHA